MYQPAPLHTDPVPLKYQPIPPHTDQVPPSTDQYHPVLTQYHRISTSTALFRPSTIISLEKFYKKSAGKEWSHCHIVLLTVFWLLHFDRFDARLKPKNSFSGRGAARLDLELPISWNWAQVHGFSAHFLLQSDPETEWVKNVFPFILNSLLMKNILVLQVL